MIKKNKRKSGGRLKGTKTIRAEDMVKVANQLAVALTQSGVRLDRKTRVALITVKKKFDIELR